MWHTSHETEESKVNQYEELEVGGPESFDRKLKRSFPYLIIILANTGKPISNSFYMNF